MGEQLAEQIAGAALEVLDDCGHVPHQERPDLVNPLLVSALSMSSEYLAGDVR